LKNKIQKSIEAMDEVQLWSAWLILKEIACQKGQPPLLRSSTSFFR
jgi:hypothetical protein